MWLGMINNPNGTVGSNEWATLIVPSSTFIVSLPTPAMARPITHIAGASVI